MKYLKDGIRIAGRAIKEIMKEEDRQVFHVFAKGLALLDDYDHELLDKKGKSVKKTVFPEFDDYMKLIREMHSRFDSDVFARPLNDGFKSSINQIRQAFGGKELYPTIEEKAANLLYFMHKTPCFMKAHKIPRR